MNDDQLSLLEVLESVNEQFTYEMICKMDDNQKNEYDELLNSFLMYNSMQPNAQYTPAELNRLKGKSLEELVSFLLRVSGNLFEVKQNLRTSTNEIDQVFQLKPNGKVLLSSKLIDDRYQLFLGECKNYNKTVGVTHVGKFCSLLLTTQVRLGILFSYHGVSGTGWSNASGLIRKFYLHKEDKDKRYFIIDINKDDFISIKNGDNLLRIVENKMLALQLDTDYTRHLSKHPAE